MLAICIFLCAMLRSVWSFDSSTIYMLDKIIMFFHNYADSIAHWKRKNKINDILLDSVSFV